MNENSLVQLTAFHGKEIPATTSLRVAEYFGKEHRNVLADVRNTMSKCSESFNGLNFQLVDYADSKGEKRPMYILSRDGFMMVAMSYITPEAMRLKEAYIAQFNAMEDLLRGGASRPLYSLADQLAAARMIYDAAGLVGNQCALAMDKLYARVNGLSALEGVNLVAPVQESLLTPTQLGRMMTPLRNARSVNQLLLELGFQRKVGDGWEPTEAGLAAGATLLDVGKAHSNGTPITQLKWRSSVLRRLM